MIQDSKNISFTDSHYQKLAKIKQKANNKIKPVKYKQEQKKNQVLTPYFLFDLKQLRKNLLFHKKTAEDLDIKLIYSIKTLSNIEILKEIAKYVKGFSVSSLFESMLANHVSNESHTTHFVSPGINTQQWPTLSKKAQFVTFNSLEQFMRFQDKLYPKVSYGIRLNPKLSFVPDDRYDPCRSFSKLGVPLSDMLDFLKNKPFAKHLQGLHFHNNCDSQDFSQMEKTFIKVESVLGKFFNQFKWLNLGGGYLFDSSKNSVDFGNLIQYIRKKYHFEHIIIEPGSSIIQNTANLVSSVIDIFKRDGKNIAILNTTVNHLPEVFEYQYQPNIPECDLSGSFEYILAGCSCLAGDVFGTYRFKNKLNVGSKITFKNVGAYSLVKANMFNGINLPDIYCIKSNNQWQKTRSYTFNDYLSYCGG